MFGNFIYFIVVLLIYSTYQAPETPLAPAFEALAAGAGMAVLFAAYVRLAFRRLMQTCARIGPMAADHRYTALVTRLSVLAVVLFALDVYGLNLPAHIAPLPGLRALPTAQALVFLLLFIGYLSIVWSVGHGVHEKIYATGTTCGRHVASNVALAVPVLLPWLMLSGVGDLIGLLPFEAPKRLLATPAGELGYFLFFLVLVALTGPALIQRFWRCRPLPPGPDRQRIAAVCQRAGMRYAEILDWPIFGGRMITAGVMGLVRRFRYILVTRSLLTHLAPEEIDQVIAHEIGHVKRHHLSFYLLFFTGYLLLAYAAFDLAIYAVLYTRPVYEVMRGTGFDPAGVGAVLLNVLMVALFLFYFRFVFGYFMRNFERQADLYVYRLFADARPLISTLVKIAVTSGISPEKPNWHHFSIGQRIDYLRRCQADPVWIDRHDRKVRRSITTYLMVLVLIAAAGWQLNFGTAGRHLSEHFLETVITRELARDAHQPDLLVLLGDLHYRRHRLDEAAGAYEQAVALAPRHAHGLNNLAWLYATSDRPELRRPQRALDLALQAAAIDPAPHVLDTLAQSYYVNGMFAEAEDTARRALAAASGTRGYFEDQLEKFRRARNNKD